MTDLATAQTADRLRTEFADPLVAGAARLGRGRIGPEVRVASITRRIGGLGRFGGPVC